MLNTTVTSLAIVTALALLLSTPSLAEDQDADLPAVQSEGRPDADAPAGNLKRLSDEHEIWIDPKRKAVVIGGEVCLREGQLEMFACLKGTKEHESVVALRTEAYLMHAALLAVGAKAGNPVRFDPEYEPAAGTEIDVIVLWKDKDGKKHSTRAQQWVRHVKSGKPMPHAWVFAGSGFWVDEKTKERHYQAEGGDVICVSNFSSAMLDLPISSSQANADLLFDAFTEHIPPRGTKVRVVLVPHAAKPKAANGEPATPEP